MNVIENEKVLLVINSYPKDVQKKLFVLRSLILEVAEALDDSSSPENTLEETLKWGEPSYCTKNGSTLRFDWKIKKPDQYSLYFNCKTTLVDTIKERYGCLFKYEGNRAIIFDLNENLPVEEVKTCIESSLQYHSIKHLPLLGL